MSVISRRYNFGGVFLPRLFKVRRLGQLGFSVENLPEGRGSLRHRVSVAYGAVGPR